MSRSRAIAPRTDRWVVAVMLVAVTGCASTGTSQVATTPAVPASSTSSSPPSDVGGWLDTDTAELSRHLLEPLDGSGEPAPEVPIADVRWDGDDLVDQRLLTSLSALNRVLDGGSMGFTDFRPWEKPMALAGFDVSQTTGVVDPRRLTVFLPPVGVPGAVPVPLDPALGLPSAVVTVDPTVLSTLPGRQFDLDVTVAGTPAPMFGYVTAIDGMEVADDPTVPGWHPGRLMVHELFHRYQQEHRWWSDVRTDEVFLPDDIIDTDGVVLATMEEQALRSALDGTDALTTGRTGRVRAVDRPRVERELGRFLALRAARVAESPDLAEYLDVTETEEGVAYWLEINTAAVAGDPAALSELDAQLGRIGDRAYYGDGSCYNVGAALLMVLDALDIAWEPDASTGSVRDIALTAYPSALPTAEQAEAPFDRPAIRRLIEEQDLAAQSPGRRGGG